MRHLITTTLFLLFPTALATLAAASQSKLVKVDDVFIRNRVKRSLIRENGPYTLGGSVPDWSDARLDGKVRYLQALIMVDARVANFYNNELEKIKTGITDLLRVVNLYLYQLDVRITLVDVSVWNKNNVSLENFLAYRNSIIKDLPEHDFAFIMSYHYGGGLAYVDVACGNSAAGLCGFHPENPAEYADIFVHELGHILGMPHDVQVPCECKDQQSGNCLRIYGFNNNCAVQALVNKLPNFQCIQTLPETLAETTVSMCGNGIRENGEQCDCGPEKYCKEWNCKPATCEKKISDFLQYLIVFFAVLIGIGAAYLAIYQNYILPYRNPQMKRQRSSRILSSVKTETPSLTKRQPVRVAPAPPVPARPPNAAIQSAVRIQHGGLIRKVRPEISAPVATIVASKKVTPDVSTRPKPPSSVQPVPAKPTLPSIHTKPALQPNFIRKTKDGKETSLNSEQTNSAHIGSQKPPQNDRALPWKPKPNVSVSVLPKPPSATLKPKLPEKAPVGFAHRNPLSSVLKPKLMLAVKPQQPSEEGKRIYDGPPQRAEVSPGAGVNNLVKLFETSKAANT